MSAQIYRTAYTVTELRKLVTCAKGLGVSSINITLFGHWKVIGHSTEVYCGVKGISAKLPIDAVIRPWLIMPYENDLVYVEQISPRLSKIQVDFTWGDNSAVQY